MALWRSPTRKIEDGAVVFRHACKLGLEGIVSKLKASPYRAMIAFRKAWNL